MSKKKKAKSFVHCEIEVAEDGSAYRINIWSDDGRPLRAQECMDAASDAIVMEFGLDNLEDPDAELPH